MTPVMLDPSLAKLFGQAVFTWLIAFWLALGALENVRHPSVNLDLVRGVLSMEQMKTLYPQIYDVFKGNRSESRALHYLVFTVIVFVESLVAMVLIWGAIGLTMALFGMADPYAARAVAAFGAVGFSAIWGMFLVGGQWFHYWCGYEGSQNTHFLATLWGAATFVVLQF